MLGFGAGQRLYDLSELPLALAEARICSGRVYTYKTSGRSNWLEGQPSVSDALGLVVLPAGQPDYIELPDDPSPDA